MAEAVTDLHREISIALLKSSGAYAVRTPKGQKEPGHYRWDPKTNSFEESQKTIYAVERSTDNLGVHLHGKFVDVDIDTDNPFLKEALDYFLPYTAHVWGRKSRPRTHRLYEISGIDAKFEPSLFPFLARVKTVDAIKVEIRGGELRSGQYSLLPGSLHPSGETYEWTDLKAARSTPVSVDVLRVVNGVRMACVVALIAPYWTEGTRNQMCMALSGFMHRAASHVMDMGSISPLFFEKKDAKEILEGLMKVAGDDESDYAMRLKTFESTWDKAESGSPVQGGTTLTKITGDPDLLSLLYILLADTPDLIEFDKFLDRYAVRNGTSNVIDIHRAGERGASYLMTVNDFRNSNMHRTIAGGSGERRQMTNILLSSARAIRIDGLAFIPNGDQIVDRKGLKYINQWRGYEIGMFPDAVSEQDVEPFIFYVRDILANKDEESYTWIISWIADLFKNPETKPGTAMAMVGKPGCGKSLLGEKIIRKIIGENHSMQTNTLESLTGNFNSDSANMLFIQCDEAINSRRQSDANKLKSMITDHTRRVEPKNVNAYQVEDCARYYFTSNNINDAIPIVDGRDDRRYAVFQVNNDYATESKAKVDHRAFWKKLHKWLDDKSNLSRIHRYLYDLGYQRDLIRKPIDSEARRRIQQHSQRGFDDWLMTIVSYEHPFEGLREIDQKHEESYSFKGGKYTMSLDGWPEMVAYRRLEDSYEHYRKRKGLMAATPTYNAQQIKQEFMTRGLLKDNEVVTARIDHKYEVWQDGSPQPITKKIRIMSMPEKSFIERYLWERFGYTVEHGKDVTDNVESQGGVDNDRGPKY